jgi:uncharacterized membrane protein YdjX (TVP38/TMEM64 family)
MAPRSEIDDVQGGVPRHQATPAGADGTTTAMNEPDNAATGKKSTLLRLLPLLVVAAAIAAAFYFGVDKYLSFEALKSHRKAALDWYAQYPALAAIGYVALYALVVALSLPGAVWMTLAGGFMFGTVAAAFYVVTGATVGALGIFLIARYALADFFREKTGEAGRRMEEGFRRNALSYLLFLRLVPLFPFWLVNLVPALLGVPTSVFVIGTFLGIIPGSVVFCSVGNGLGAIFDSGGELDPVKIIRDPEVLGPLLALAALSLVPIVYRRWKAGPDAPGQ